MRSRQDNHERTGQIDLREQTHHLDLFAAHHVHRFAIVQPDVWHIITHAGYEPDWFGEHFRQRGTHHAARQVIESGRRRQVRHFMQAESGCNHARRDDQIHLIDAGIGLFERCGDRVPHGSLQHHGAAADRGIAHPGLCRHLSGDDAAAPQADSRVGRAGIDSEDGHHDWFAMLRCFLKNPVNDSSFVRVAMNR